ncbi:Bol1p KNAG_0D05060 [Huiozyma naganishii CBS 8797]|uniref:BolA protein n=1 Tax=Huiozyma naganishii (strain ATCC MYA-139 / BCRC 22969 / CBS 8797 / KCTC 17520 / NBRC 10181 / NCYC 3082 / Yp74L-3) TaxID=1071383 RepID=J7R5V8_HUIN7|nr:hypothetical protein KNAG_0D05060 [Kazachstania naganishii CBS 8797]CCK70245.1 hypothetical protein KNAG_0D05060 [Kazachstania naganishii CBS 8797]
MWRRAMLQRPLNQSVEGPAFTAIRARLQQSIPDATHLQLYNDSFKHAGHGGNLDARDSNESHIRVEVTAQRFSGMKTLQRHRFILREIKDEMDKYKIHAIQMVTKTPEEAERAT